MIEEKQSSKDLHRNHFLETINSLKNINSKPQSISEKAKESIAQIEIDSTSLSNLMRTGNVNFSESQTKLDSCNIYVIEGEFNNKDIILEVENCETKATLNSIRILE